MKSIKTIAIAAAATVFVTTPAFANPEQAQTPSASVEYDDLDLTAQSGREILDRRINRAVRSLCAAKDRSTTAQRRATQCRLAAKETAQPQVRFAILEANGTKLALNAQAIAISPPRG